MRISILGLVLLIPLIALVACGDAEPKKDPVGEFEQVDTTGRWGLLPPKEAEDLQRHDIDEFPQRYRRWMELYYRRVNRSSGN